MDKAVKKFRGDTKHGGEEMAIGDTEHSGENMAID